MNLPDVDHAVVPIKSGYVKLMCCRVSCWGWNGGFRRGHWCAKRLPPPFQEDRLCLKADRHVANFDADRLRYGYLTLVM